jgi:hypothetical protein
MQLALQDIGQLTDIGSSGVDAAFRAVTALCRPELVTIGSCLLPVRYR